MASYGTKAAFLAYHLDRTNPTAGYSDAAIAAALLIASEWLDGKYQSLFPGLKVGQRAQVREWPRQGALDRDGYAIASDIPPSEIDAATYEAAYKQLLSPGSLNRDWTPPKYKRASIDGAVSVEYVTFSNASDTQTRFAVIDAILRPILTGGGVSAMSGLSGATARV